MAISGNVDALPAARTNDVIHDLLKRKSDLDEQYAEALDQYGPNFPKVVAACGAAEGSTTTI